MLISNSFPLNSTQLDPSKLLFQLHPSHSPFPDHIVSPITKSTDAIILAQSLRDLESFMDDLFFLQMQEPQAYQALALASFILLLVVIGGTLILHRIFKRQLGLFRLTRRMEGVYIIPNALNCFLIFEGIFGIILATFTFITCDISWRKNPARMDVIQIFRIITWIPLYLGAFLAGWGSFYTAPGVLDRASAQQHGKRRSALGMLLRPMMINFICLGSPFILVGSLAFPCYRSQHELNQSFRQYQRWLSNTKAQLLSPNHLTQVEAQDVLRQASAIFDTLALSYQYLGIGFAVWSFWSLAFFMFYVPAGGYLVYLLWQQVKKNKAVLSLLGNQPKLEMPRYKPFESTLLPPISHQEAEHIGSDYADLHKGTRDSQAPTSVQISIQPGQRGGSSSGDVHSHMGLKEEYVTPPTSPTAPSLSRSSNVLKPVRKSRPYWLRPLSLVESKKPISAHPSSCGAFEARFNYIQRCLFNLVTFYIGIVAATAAFSIITIRLSVKLRTIGDPTALSRIYVTSNLVVLYASSVFGLLTIGSIGLRNFDGNAAAEKIGENDDEKNKAQRDSKNGDVVEYDHHQDMNRTLPPVPESVGSDTHVRIGTRSHHHPSPTLNKAMRFSVARTSEHPDALVLELDEPTASILSLPSERIRTSLDESNSPDLSSSSARHTRSSRNRRLVSKSSTKGILGSNSSRMFQKDEQEGCNSFTSSEVMYPSPYGPVSGHPLSSNGQSLRRNISNLTNYRHESSIGDVSRHGSFKSFSDHNNLRESPIGFRSCSSPESIRCTQLEETKKETESFRIAQKWTQSQSQSQSQSISVIGSESNSHQRLDLTHVTTRRKESCN